MRTAARAIGALTSRHHRHERYPVRPPEQEADRRATAKDRAMDADGFSPLLGVVECHREQGKCGRSKQRREGALKTTGREQEALARRQATKCGSSGKPTRPTTNARLRPTWSAIRPPSSSRPPKAWVYAVTTHCWFASLIPRRLWYWVGPS